MPEDTAENDRLEDDFGREIRPPHSTLLDCETGLPFPVKPFQFHLSTAIILMLVASVLLWLFVQTVLQAPMKLSKKARTRALLHTISNACECYELQWCAYPPESAPNGATGSEALYYYLATPFRTVPSAAKGEVRASIDSGPYLNLRTEQLATGPQGGPYFVDLWGQAVEYDNVRDDSSRPAGFTLGPNDPRTDGKPRNMQGFDLWSPGEPGSNKAITNW